MVTAGLALDTEPAGIVRTAAQALLHFLANGHVFQFHNITSQDVKLGVRWNLWSPPAYAPPLITKG